MQFKIVNDKNEEQDGNFAVDSDGKVLRLHLHEYSYDDNDLFISWDTDCDDQNGVRIHSCDSLMYEGEVLTLEFEEGSWLDSDGDIMGKECNEYRVANSNKLKQLIELLGEVDGAIAYASIS